MYIYVGLFASFHPPPTVFIHVLYAGNEMPLLEWELPIVVTIDMAAVLS
jgi:hypothetical protein